MQVPVTEVEEKIAELEEAIKKGRNVEELLWLMAQYVGKDELVQSLQDRQRRRNAPREAWSVKTGLPTLDRMTRGLVPGNLIVVSAPTGNGKTKLLETITVNLQSKQESLWFSYEMGYEELYDRFGENLPVFYLPKELTDKSMKWIEERILEGVAKFGVRVVFIDHLHYLFDMETKINTSLHLGSLVRQLKRIAVERGVVIFLVAHTGKVEGEKALTINDIRDSSMISAEADYVVMLKRDGELSDAGWEYRNSTTLMLQKNRRTGELGSVKLLLRNGIFEEVSNRNE